MKNKKDLLEIAERSAKYINSKRYSDFIKLIINMIRIAKKENGEELKKIKFYNLIDAAKITNLDILAGGKNIKVGFVDYFDNYFYLKKMGNNFIVKNPDLSGLNIDELEFVFLWTSRLIKKDSNSNFKKSYSGDKPNYNSKNNKNNGRRNSFSSGNEKTESAFEIAMKKAMKNR